MRGIAPLFFGLAMFCFMIGALGAAVRIAMIIPPWAVAILLSLGVVFLAVAFMLEGRRI